MDKQFMLWRRQLLAGSETFIANQVHAMKRWRATFVGKQFIPNSLGVQPQLLVETTAEPQLRQIMLRSSFVHAHFSIDAVEIAAVARCLNLPLIATFHGFDVTVRRITLSPVRRLQLKRMFKTAHTLIAVSGFIRNQLVGLGAPPEKIVVHHVGIPVPVPSDVQPAFRRGILFVGRLVDKKGCDDLLKAAKLLPASLREQPISIIGDGPLRLALERRARGARLNVKFLGAQPPQRVHEAMRSAAVVCVPSRRARNGDAEGLPTVVLEAAAFGAPIVATTASGIPEAVDHTQSALLVRERDPEMLAVALTQLLTNKELGARLSSTAEDRIRRHFDINVQTSLLESLYDNVADTGRNIFDRTSST